jgi:hypothetical protein
VPALVEGAALYQRTFTEHVGDRLAQRLGTVRHSDDAVLVAQPAGDQIGEPVVNDDTVLGVAEDQPDGNLLPSAVMTRATMIIRSATLRPSTINTAVSRPD